MKTYILRDPNRVEPQYSPPSNRGASRFLAVLLWAAGWQARNTVPAMVRENSGAVLMFADFSGRPTSPTPDGKVVWMKMLGTGRCQAPPQAVSSDAGKEALLVSNRPADFA